MLKPAKRLQPRSYHAFRCIGADCEDTCCIGWIVNVDKHTYETYQRCDHPELSARLHELVTINASGSSDDNYARIKLSEAGCPFLSEGLCSIQNKLGEEYLSIMCATYPRVMNVVDDVLQRSLDLSCPEAARSMLLDASPMQFDEDEGPSPDSRRGHLSILSTTNLDSGKPYQYFHEIRGFVIWLLQYRPYPLWKRLVILGAFCDQLHEMAEAGQSSETFETVQSYRDAVHRKVFDRIVDGHAVQSAAQLGMVLELIVGRIGSDFTPPRFLECYREFMEGIEWTAQSSMDDIGRRYAAAYAQCYAPFMSLHEYMLEHYLVNYVHRTLFPLGPQESDRDLSVHHIADSIRTQCLLMIVYFAMTQTVLIGVAAFYQAKFDAGHVIKVIQSSTKTFEHSLAFPSRALQILKDNKVENCSGLAMLIRC